ncbi:MAG: hypothetical protein IJ148_10775 [Bacteroidaceae bacterium]|nr:hypothetical protein [Bacteroidaceae bacterium]
MKKTYMQPTTNVESAQPTNLLCESFKGDTSTGLVDGGGSSGEAHALESAWNIWGDEE